LVAIGVLLESVKSGGVFRVPVVLEDKGNRSVAVL